MAIARVVAFEGVTAERIAQLKSEMEAANGPPDDVPAHELVLLHDPQGERSLALVFFESEEDYARGDEILGSMPADQTPGRRLSVDKYDVAVRLTATAS